MTGFWICLAKDMQHASGSKYARAQNIVRLWIFKGYTGCWICLTKLEYALIMLKVLENACIDLNKQSSEYTRTLCLMQYIA